MKTALPVIINRTSAAAAGLGDRLADAVALAFDFVGQPIALQLVDGDRFEDALRRHVGAPIVVVGGGDRSLTIAARVLAESFTAVAILPLGARNDLARRLGVPAALDQAAAVCVRGQRRRIDLGLAGDRIFLGRVAFGAAAVCAAREARAEQSTTRIASLRSAWRRWRAARAQRYRLLVDGDAQTAQSPGLSVEINQGAIDPDRVGDHDLAGERRLFDGGLTLCAVVRQRSIESLTSAMRALWGRGDTAQTIASLCEAREIVIERGPDGSGEIDVAVDGELIRARLPLTLRNAQGALGFISPREPDANEATLPLAHHF